MSNQTILLVEDEEDMRRGLRTVLETEGYRVLEAATGPDALEEVDRHGPDLILLDLMIPGLDGFGVCRQVRARGHLCPILILTARSGEVDKVLGLELGADDYVTKPFALRELVARIRALLRRAGMPSRPGHVVQIGRATVDLNRLRVERGEQLFELYHYELEILKLLLERDGEAVDRKEMLNRIWGFDSFPTTRTVDYHVCNLRKKLEPEPSQPRHILTVHGIGYRLVR